MGQLVFQATLGGQVNLVGPNTASTYNINVPTVNGNMVTTGDTGTVTNTMLAGSIANNKLLNSSVTFGTTTVALGATSTTLDGVNIGATTPGTGAFTTLSASGNVTYSGGTANGVLYLNGSKVATSGSALTFDGTKLAVLSSSAAVLGSFKSTSTSNQNVQLQVLNDNDTPLNIGVFGSSAGTFGILGASTPFMTTNASTLNFANTNASGSIVWGLGSSATEAMRLTSTGLGIGTSSPGAKLHVSGGRTLAITGNENYSLGIGRESNTNAYYLGVHSTSNPNLLFSNNAGTTNMTLTYDGNLGLGVTPSAWGTTNSVKGFQLPGVSLWGYANTNAYLNANSYYNGSNRIYVTSSYATEYAQTAGQHQWYTAPSGTAGTAITFTQAMTLDASKSLLVGTTTAPTDGGFYRSIVSFKQLNDSGYTSGIQLEANGNTNLLGIGYNGDTFQIGTSYRSTGAYTGISFATSGSERARIDTSGVVLIGLTSVFNGSTCPLQVSNNASNQTLSLRNQGATPYGQYIFYSGASPNNTANEFLYCSDTTAQRFTARSNGGLANYSGNNVNLSDRREKTNFAPAGEYLSKICAIPVQTFNYIDQNMEDDPGLTLGVVAQDVQAVAPELVSESNWGSKEEPKMRLSIYQTDLQYALMKCIQELKAENDNLKARLDAANL